MTAEREKLSQEGSGVAWVALGWRRPPCLPARGHCLVAERFSCRAWWCFALNANLHEIREQRRRCTWGFLSHRARDAVSYTDRYFSKLKGGLLSADDKVSRPASCVSGPQSSRMSVSQRRVKRESAKKPSP